MRMCPVASLLCCGGAAAAHLTACTPPPAATAAQTVWVVDGMQRVRPDAPAGSDKAIELYAARGTVWVVDGMQRVRPDAPAGSDKAIELYAARGEYEPFQVVVRAGPGGLRVHDVVASDLVGPGGAVIPARNVTLYREHYIRLVRGSRDEPGWENRPEGAGWYPEPLVPFVDPATGGRPKAGARLTAVPFDLPAGRNQPFWVDVFVPRGGTPPGRYTGTVTAETGHGRGAVAFAVNVWNFELPVRPSLKSHFRLWQAGDLAGLSELMRHKLLPSEVYRPEWRPALIALGLNAANLAFWSGLDAGKCNASGTPSMRNPPSPDEVAAKAAGYPQGVATYAFFADEIAGCATKPGMPDRIKVWARVLQRGGATPLLTDAPRDEWWIDGPYIWANMPAGIRAHPREIARAQAAGQEVWSYNSLAQNGYSPKWLVDYGAANFRNQAGFISQSLGLKGLLYWRVDFWVEGAGWDDLTAFGDAHPGDGTLVYPGSWVGIGGVAPGMRLKWLREGVEDYEYVEILKGLGQAVYALEVARSVGASFTSWTRDPEALHAARMRLGERIHRIMSGDG